MPIACFRTLLLTRPCVRPCVCARLLFTPGGRPTACSFTVGKILCTLSRYSPLGDSFRVLGIDFDCKLVMEETVRSCVTQSNWKLRTLLRTERFHSTAELSVLYKCHIMSFIEFRTPGIAHAASTVLAPLDHILDHFLHGICMAKNEALMRCHLAPLSVRRDIALLGVIHRGALGLGPPALRHAFVRDVEPPPPRAPRRHARHLIDPCAVNWPDYALRSVLGGVRLYNLLPD